MIRKVDHSALRTNQAFIIGLLLLAFVLGTWVLVVFVSAVMVIGTVFPQAGLFKRFYQHVLKPRGWVEPDVIEDNPEPHLFAQGLGGVFLAIATVALLADVAVVGWSLVFMVIGLAALNLFAGFCAGCFIYYQLSSRGIPGFKVQPINRPA
ncbi:MAG: DUF4395 domain-containing protein [Anaerolineae bacterium]|nr:MAG: DUF4395 domain-containing protein [Anaerolineae bacterium]